MVEIPRLFVLVLVLISQSNSLLLVKQSHIDDTWGLVGGIVEYGRPIDAIATTYAKEQTGLEVALSRIVGVYTSQDRQVLTITFQGEITGKQHSIDSDHQQYAEFFSLEHLPKVEEAQYRYIDDYLSRDSRVIFRAQ